MADLSKLDGYAVTGGANTAATTTKLVAYAVTAGSDSFESLSKVVAYAVTEITATAKRPQIFVAT